jgi:multiple sugar transport system permease protein
VASTGSDDGAAASPQRRLLDWTRGTSLGVEARDRRDLWVMVAPAVLVVLGFGIFPLVYSVWVSFHLWEPLSQAHPGTGVGNYRQVLSDPLLHDAVVRTVVFVAVVVPVQTLLGLGLALLVEKRAYLRRIFFSVFLLPLLIMPIVVGYMWRQMWEAPYGMVNSVLGTLLGHDVTTNWLGNPDRAFAALAITEIWQWTPFMFVVLLAALTGVPVNLREAAAVDGSGAWVTFRVVVLPAIMPVLTVAVILRLLEAANFYATVYAITQGGPGTSTYSLVYYIAQLAQFGRHGVAAAASFLFLLGLAIPVGLLVMRLLHRQSALAGRT